MIRNFALALGLAALLPSASQAAPASPERIAYDLGRCLVDTDRRVAVELMSSLPVSGNETVSAAQYLGASAGRCPNIGMKLNTVAIRGGIAQALYRRDFREYGAEPGRRLVLAAFVLPTAEGAGVDARTAALYSLGACVVRRNASRVDQLLRSPVGSTMERNIVAALASDLGPCVPPGAQTRMRRDELRGILAQSAYSVAARYWRSGEGDDA